MRDKLINTFFTSDFTVLVLSNKVIIRKGKSGIMSGFTRDIVQEYEYNSHEDIAGILEKATKNLNPQSTDRWFLGLPLKYFTLVNFTLPRAALDNLDEAVRYSLMRHVPYDLDQARVNFQMNENGDYLDISAVIIPKQTLKPFLKSARSADITFYNVFPSMTYWSRVMGDGIYVSHGPGYGEALIYQNGKITFQTWAASREEDTYFLEETRRLLANISDQPSTLYLWEYVGKQEHIIEKLEINPKEIKILDLASSASHFHDSKPSGEYEINLLPKAVLKQKKMATYLVYAGVIFFILSLFVLPLSKLAGQKRHLAKIEKRLESVSAKADELNKIREENRQIMDRIEFMADMKKAYPSTINILAELTEVIPETAWVSSLKYSQTTVTIQGDAESATAVIEAIENSPRFEEVRFSSPVTKSGPRERFTLEAEVVT